MVSVSIYIYRFAALLADVVALAVGAVVCAGRFLALEFNYTFNRGVVSAVLVAVGVIGCGLAVERMRLFGDCFLYGQLDTVFDVGVNNQSLLQVAGVLSSLTPVRPFSVVTCEPSLVQVPIKVKVLSDSFTNLYV